MVPYQCLKVDRMDLASRCSSYVPIHPFWEALDCCRGMLVDLPFVVTYCGDVLWFTSHIRPVIDTMGRLPHGMGGEVCQILLMGSLRYVQFMVYTYLRTPIHEGS